MPDFDKFGRFIQAGALLLISEAIIASQPGASTKVLFLGSFTEVDRSRAFLRLDVVMRAFAAAHPSQKGLALKALVAFENLLRECVDWRIDMKSVPLPLVCVLCLYVCKATVSVGTEP